MNILEIIQKYQKALWRSGFGCLKQILVPSCLLLMLFSQTLCAAAQYHLISDIGASARMISIGGVEGFDHSAAIVVR